jgi:hypothetical protein
LLRISLQEAFKPKQPQDWVLQSKRCATVKHLARGVTLQDRLIFSSRSFVCGAFHFSGKYAAGKTHESRSAAGIFFGLNPASDGYFIPLDVVCKSLFTNLMSESSFFNE